VLILKPNINKRGFTLVEVLLATIISCLVILTAFAAYHTVVQTRQLLLHKTEVLSQGRYVLNLIRNDLANVHRSADHQRIRLTGTTYVREGRHMDTLLMPVVSDQLYKIGRTGKDVCVVEYSMQLAPEADEFRLYRRCASFESANQTKKRGLLTCIGTGIVELRFEYYAEGTWHEQWNKETGFPSLIRITLEMAEDKSENSRVHSVSQIVSLTPFPKAAFTSTDLELQRKEDVGTQNF